MRFEQYTADAIGRAMGIASVATLPPPTVRSFRVLLKPSYTPEVCLTAIESDSEAIIEVVSLYEMLWHRPFPCVLRSETESLAIEREFFQQLNDLFHDAWNAIHLDARPVVVCDGMGIDMFRRCECNTEKISTYVSGRPLATFLETILPRLHSGFRNRLLRNNLAHCGKYARLELGLETPLHFESPKRYLGVFGVEEDRTEIIRALSNKPESHNKPMHPSGGSADS